MRKSVKRLLCLAGLIAAPAVINKIIFNNAKKKSKRKIKENYYEWRHCDIRYVTAGEGEPLLLVHGIGIGSGLHEWEGDIIPLSKRYKVYAIDLAGFGGSGKPKITYSAYFFITLINDFIKDVIKEKVNIAAANASGAFAVMAYSFQPENFNKMLLISPEGVGTSGNLPNSSSLFVRALAESSVLGTSLYNIAASRLSIGWFLQNRCYSGGFAVTDGLIDKYYYPAHYGDERAKYAVASYVSGYLNVNIESKLSRIEIPVHIVWGGENIVNPIGNYDVIRHRNPNIGMTVFEDARLLPHAEFPKEFYRACVRFFG